MEKTPERGLSKNFRFKEGVNQRYGKRRSFFIYHGSKDIPPYTQRFKADLSRCDENLIVREPNVMKLDSEFTIQYEISLCNLISEIEK